MNSKHLWKLLAALGVLFALPWLLLVVLPYLDQSAAAPAPYGEGDSVDGGIAAYPDRTLQRHGASDYGREIYAAEGCAYCHTQVVRPTYAGADRWRVGWGGREGEQGDFARETQPGDYANESVAPLGYQRVGQDLANVGHRIPTAAEMHRHLFDPKSIDPDSGMPALKHLYDGSADRPKPKAVALADYLLSLKKDQPLPKSYLSGN